MSFIPFGLILSAIVLVTILLFVFRRGSREAAIDTVRLKITGTSLRALQTFLDSGDPHLLAFRKLYVHGDPGLVSCLPPDWATRLQEAVTDLTHRQIEYSVALRLDEVHAALKYTQRSIVLTGTELPAAIVRDVGAGAIAFRVACHNLVVWLNSSEAQAREYYSATLPTTGHCSAADLLAMHVRATTIARLYDRTLELKAFLSHGSTSALSAASAAFNGNIATLMQFIVIYLPGEDVIRAWQKLTRAEPIYKHSWFFYGREVVGYKWFVQGGAGYSDLNDICKLLVVRPCTETDIYTGFAQLIGVNPFRLIWRLSVAVNKSSPHLDWTPVLSQLVTNRGTEATAIFSDFHVLLAPQYWLLHDRLAKWIIRCVGAASTLPELNSLLVSLVAEIVNSQLRMTGDEVYWGSQHFILCCSEQLLSHLKLHPEILAVAGRGQPMQELLLSGHRLAMSNRTSERTPDDGSPRARFSTRYRTFCSKQVAQASRKEALAKLQEICIGAFYPGPPQYLSTWPQTAIGNGRAWSTRPLPVGWTQYPFILDQFPWGDPYDELPTVLKLRGWAEIEGQRYKYTSSQTTIALDLVEKTFFVEPNGNGEATEQELSWISFAAYAAALARKYGGAPKTDRVLGRITLETFVGSRPIRAVFDCAGRSWAVDPMEVMTQLECK